MDFELSRAHKMAQSLSFELFAERSIHGVIRVCQKKRMWDPYEFMGETILHARDYATPVFGLTENWSVHGEAVSWGYMPLLLKFQELALDRQKQKFEEIRKHEEKLSDSKSKDRKNLFVDMASDLRGSFKKAFSDTNTSSLDHTNDLRRKTDRRIKNGDY